MVLFLYKLKRSVVIQICGVLFLLQSTLLPAKNNTMFLRNNNIEVNKKNAQQKTTSIEQLPPALQQFILKHLTPASSEINQRKVKITASALAITLGVFGVHRLYLGTSPVVPAVYVATVGGGIGILPFVDLMAILFTKDITPYLNNKQIFMWAN